MSESNLKKLVENKTAIVCLTILIFLSALSALSHVFLPDKTRNANIQIPQIALKSPGHSEMFVLKEKNLRQDNRKWGAGIIRGYSDDREYIPIDSYRIDGQVVHLKYKNQTRTMELADIISSIDPLHRINFANNHITYRDILGSAVSLDQKQAIRVFEKKHVKTRIFLLGTDKYGRDNLSRLILGLRVSLFIGLVSVLISISLGTLLGCIGGYYGGWIDRIITLLINTSWSIPTLLLAFAIILAFGKGLTVIFLAIGLTMWVDVARLVRGQVMQIKNEAYVQSARIIGVGSMNTIVRHILPNILGPLLVIAAANFATAILVESGLSYLGLGIQPPTPSLGNLLKENYAYATGGFVFLALFPIVTIMVLVLCFNLLGTALRDIYDTKLE